MRRNAADILFVYHYTHRVRRPFLPSVSSPSPFSSLSPAPLIGPSSLSSPLVFHVLLFSLSLSPPLASHRAVCIYFILLLNKPLFLSSSRQHASLHVHTGSTSNTVSTWREDRLTRPFQTRKIFFPYPLLILGITPPSRIPRYLRGCVGRLSRLLKGSSISKGSWTRLKRIWRFEYKTKL